MHHKWILSKCWFVKQIFLLILYKLLDYDRKFKMFLFFSAYLHHSGVYRTCRGNRELEIHPLSCLYTIRQPQYIVFCELLHTTKVFMKEITVIEGDWLTELAPHYYVKRGVRYEDR